MGDLNNLIVINYYKLLASMTADYKFDMNEALYDINSKHFTMTFLSSSNITSNNTITIKIATGYTGSADSMDLNSFTSNISVELTEIKELKRDSWYTAYCLYNESQNKWIGYLISASADVDTSAFQTKANLVTSINENSTDEQYPSAKLLYDMEIDVNNVRTDLETHTSNLVTSIDENSTDLQYPSAKLLYDIVGNCNIVLDEISALIGE